LEIRKLRSKKEEKGGVGESHIHVRRHSGKKRGRKKRLLVSGSGDYPTEKVKETQGSGQNFDNSRGVGGYKNVKGRNHDRKNNNGGENRFQTNLTWGKPRERAGMRTGQGKGKDFLKGLGDRARGKRTRKNTSFSKLSTRGDEWSISKREKKLPGEC